MEDPESLPGSIPVPNPDLSPSPTTPSRILPSEEFNPGSSVDSSSAIEKQKESDSSEPPSSPKNHSASISPSMFPSNGTIEKPPSFSNPPTVEDYEKLRDHVISLSRYVHVYIKTEGRKRHKAATTIQSWWKGGSFRLKNSKLFNPSSSSFNSTSITSSSIHHLYPHHSLKTKSSSTLPPPLIVPTPPTPTTPATPMSPSAPSPLLVAKLNKVTKALEKETALRKAQGALLQVAWKALQEYSTTTRELTDKVNVLIESNRSRDVQLSSMKEQLSKTNDATSSLQSSFKSLSDSIAASSPKPSSNSRPAPLVIPEGPAGMNASKQKLSPSGSSSLSGSGPNKRSTPSGRVDEITLMEHLTLAGVNPVAGSPVHARRPSSSPSAAELLYYPISAKSTTTSSRPSSRAATNSSPLAPSPIPQALSPKTSVRAPITSPTATGSISHSTSWEFPPPPPSDPLSDVPESRLSLPSAPSSVVSDASDLDQGLESGDSSYIPLPAPPPSIAPPTEFDSGVSSGPDLTSPIPPSLAQTAFLHDSPHPRGNFSDHSPPSSNASLSLRRAATTSRTSRHHRRRSSQIIPNPTLTPAADLNPFLSDDENQDPSPVVMVDNYLAPSSSSSSSLLSSEDDDDHARPLRPSGGSVTTSQASRMAVGPGSSRSLLVSPNSSPPHSPRVVISSPSASSGSHSSSTAHSSSFSRLQPQDVVSDAEEDTTGDLTLDDDLNNITPGPRMSLAPPGVESNSSLDTANTTYFTALDGAPTPPPPTLDDD